MNNNIQTLEQLQNQITALESQVTDLQKQLEAKKQRKRNRGAIKTTIEEAVAYWSQYVDECDLSVDWGEAHMRCW